MIFFQSNVIYSEPYGIFYLMKHIYTLTSRFFKLKREPKKKRHEDHKNINILSLKFKKKKIWNLQLEEISAVLTSCFSAIDSSIFVASDLFVDASIFVASDLFDASAF